MPKRLPRFSEVPIDTIKRERLRKWLSLWHLHNSVQIPSIDAAVDLEIDLDVSIAPFDEEINEGDIRLLSHSVTGEISRPLYVAVASEWPHHEYLVSPFSGFPEPSFPGELLTGLLDPRWKVLSTWNSLVVPEAVLSKSWRVGTLGTELRDDIVHHFKALTHGLDFNQNINTRVGQDLINSDDPRHDYVQTEISLLEKFVNECEDSGIVIIFPLSMQPKKHIAAASGKSAVCEILLHAKETDTLIKVRFNPNSKIRRMYVYESTKGEILSNKLNGYIVESYFEDTKKPPETGIIRKGKLDLPYNCSRFLITSPEGEILGIEPTSLKGDE